MRNGMNCTRHMLIGLGLLALTPLLLGFLCIPLVAPVPSGPATPPPNAIFAPTVSASVSNPTPGVPADIEVHLSVPAGSTLPIGATFHVPAGWTVASDAGVTDGSIVGSISGFMTVADPFYFYCDTGVTLSLDLLEATVNTDSKVAGTDTDLDGKPEVVEDNDGNGLPDGVDKYPTFLNTVLPGAHRARYFGHTEAGGLSDLYVNVVVDEQGSAFRITTIVNDPTAPPESATSQFCAPQDTTLTLSGTSADNPSTGAPEGGQAVYTNPAQGQYTFGAALVSEFDRDNDGVSNGLDNCPATGNASQADADRDYVGDACDESVDPPTPTPTPDFDVDSDGVENGYDNCIFIANANQADSDFDDIGDACDSNSSVPDGPNYYLSCTDPVGIGKSDPGAASCVQGTPTPKPNPAVGGIAELPEVDGTLLETSNPSGPNAGLLVAIAAAVAAGAIALGGAAWYAWRRQPRR